MLLADFRQRPLVADAFPIKFANGAKWISFVAHCSRCQEPRPPQDLRGDVLPVPEDETAYRTAPDVRAYFIDAQVYCPDCNLLTPIRYLLADSMHLVGLRGNKVAVWGPMPWWRHLVLWFRELVS